MSTAATETVTTDQTQALQFTNAISQSQAIIEFELDGTIITANDNFCAALGYRLSEIQGQHHRIFMDGAEAASPEYRAFWADLADGKFRAGEFRRITKSGDEIWIQASYNPVFNEEGKPYKVVKIASDVTAQKQAALKSEAEAKMVTEMMRQLPLNVMLVDKDLKLTYMNDTSLETLRSIEHMLPVKADDMIGTCIDVFHENPAVQRRILGRV